MDDLSDDAILSILARSRELLRSPDNIAEQRFAAGLLFLSPSLRTRVGFEIAVARLGGVAIDISERRSGSEMSAAESLGDTLRTLSAWFDVVVTRTPQPLESHVRMLQCAVVNGGEQGGEHPTQALVDLLACTEECGALKYLRIGICGDLSSRSVRSLIGLFSRFPPRSLRLMGPPKRAPLLVGLSTNLAERTTVLESTDFSGLDVLYMAGLSAGIGRDALSDEVRRRYSLRADDLAHLDGRTVVISPLPVVDEVEAEARFDPRVRLFAGSDRSVAVRIAILEYCLAG